MAIEVKLLGPDGIRARMAEIRAQLDSLCPAHSVAGPSGDKPLGGAIGPGGFQPFDPTGPGVRWNPAVAPDALRPVIDDAARQAGVDRDLLDALVAVESAYDPQARSRAGALGLTQLMPDTAKALGVANPFDPVQNLNAGARYLSDMLSRFGGDLQLALAAYNAGPGAVDRFGGVPPYPETKAYIAKVVELYEQRRAGG